jgi:hypothetical protein
MRRATVRAVLVAAAATLTLAALAVPRDAAACGGFFCSTTPIDQSAERIIFAQRGNEITAWVQVVYSGSAEDFAWVVPVSAVPELDVAESSIFNVLDQATAPVITPPDCLFNQFGAPTAADGAEGGAGGGSRNDDGVTVYSEATVGPYDTAVVGSDNADVLIDWLNERDYVITDPMRPMVEEYVNDGLLFMAMRLSADQDVDALRPIVMRYEGTNPVVPIRLTAVAAEPNMGIIVWLLGEGRATTANFSNPTLAPGDFRFDDFLRNNYRTVVSRTVDAAGGQAFITEYAAPTSELQVFDEETEAILADYDWITRMYTTISPEEMTSDPVFTFNPNLPAVSNIIDLSDRTELCESVSSPCDFNHCGPGATCYEVNGAAACSCAAGFAARGVADPTLGAAVTCVPENGDMLGEAGGDPCASVSCGEFGACVAVNGDATCACDLGYIGANESGQATCIAAELGVPHDPAVIVYGDTPAGAESAGCSVAHDRTPSRSALLALLAAFGLLAGLGRAGARERREA